MPGAHHDAFLERIDPPRGFSGIDECMEPLIALPTRLHAKRAVARAGEAATKLGHAPHHRAEGQRGLRRGVVRRQGIKRGPFPRVTEPFAGHLWLGAARPRDRVDPPGHHARACHGVQPPLSRLHASRRALPPWRAHQAKPCALPPTLRPRQHQTGPRDIPHGQTRASAPGNRLRTAGWAALLGIDGDDLHGGRWPPGRRAPLTSTRLTATLRVACRGGRWVARSRFAPSRVTPHRGGASADGWLNTLPFD
jgi:hypothetical protein